MLTWAKLVSEIYCPKRIYFITWKSICLEKTSEHEEALQSNGFIVVSQACAWKTAEMNILYMLSVKILIIVKLSQI